MSDYENKLQEGTKIILGNISEEYKNLLIEKIILDKKLKRIEDILPEDIIIINEEFRRSIKIKKNKTKREKSFFLIKFVGFIYAAFGVWLYIYSSISPENYIQRFSVTIIGSGVFVFSLAYFLDKLSLGIKKTSKYEREMNEYRLVQKWNEIEMLSYSIINIKEQNISGNIPINKIISILLNNEILNIVDVNDFKYILNLRNTIVHSTESKIAQNQILDGLKKAERIITKLKNVQ